jgi:hypothetical protein
VGQPDGVARTLRSNSENVSRCRMKNRRELGFEPEFSALASHCSGVGNHCFSGDFLTNRTERHCIGVGLTLPILLPNCYQALVLNGAFWGRITHICTVRRVLEVRLLRQRLDTRICDAGQAGCSSEPISRITSNSTAALDSRLSSGLLVSGSKAVKRPRVGRNAQTS